MGGVASALIRISPKRCTVMIPPEGVRELAKAGVGNEDPQLAPHGATTMKKPKRYTETGLEIIERKSVSIPDPRISNGGHCFLALWHYTAFCLAIAWVVWNLVSYVPQETNSTPLIGSRNPKVPLRFELSCPGTTTATFFSNYTVTSPCFNASTAMTTVQVNSSITTTTLAANLCVAPESSYSSSDSFPPIAGLWFHLNIPSLVDSACVVDIYSLLAGASTTTPLKRIGVEPGWVKTLWLSYSATVSKNDNNAMVSQSITPVYYELDGTRENQSDTSAVVVLKFASTANIVTRFDMRDFAAGWGFFGTIWRLSGMIMFWLEPLLFALFSRNFMEDAKAGKLDGFTEDLLANAGRPGAYVGFTAGVIGRIKQAIA
jgi:hypothetical protein